MNLTNHWWQLKIDNPITSTLVCAIALVIVTALAGFIAGGRPLATLLAPLGALTGASLALRLSNHPTMRKWRCMTDQATGRAAKFIFLYGLPVWIGILIRYGIGFTVVVMGGLSALIILGGEGR